MGNRPSKSRGEAKRIRQLLESREAKRRVEALERLRNVTPWLGGWTWDPDGANVIGKCGRCSRRFPAISLAWKDETYMFGVPVPPGWFCPDCRPRAFGRLNGDRPIGWPMPSLDGELQRLSRMLAPLGSPTGKSRSVQHRKRKPKPMKPLI